MTHHQTDAPLDELLRWAERGRGWAFREWPPQSMRLAGGCTLIVLVPVLWRGRCRPRPTTKCELVRLSTRRKVA